jgi:hypothetical protein
MHASAHGDSNRALQTQMQSSSFATSKSGANIWRSRDPSTDIARTRFALSGVAA